MSKARLLAAILVALPTAVTGHAAMAMPVDLAGYCGFLHSADVRQYLAPPKVVLNYRWIEASLTGNVLTVTLVVTNALGTSSYSGFQCLITGGKLTAIPYNAGIQ